MARSATLLLAAVCACAAPAKKMAWPTEANAPHHTPIIAEPDHHEPAYRDPNRGIETIERLPVVTLSPHTALPAGGGLESRPPSYLPSIHPASLRRNESVELLPGQLTFRWPLPATGVNSLFGNRKDPIDASSRFHFGVDLAADYGEIVESTAPGVVVYGGWNGGHGRTIVVDHEGGYRSVYSHLAQVLVYSGAWVEAGRAIGRVGNSGRSTGAHLHFELLLNGKHLDPLDLMGSSVEID